MPDLAAQIKSVDSKIALCGTECSGDWIYVDSFTIALVDAEEFHTRGEFRQAARAALVANNILSMLLNRLIERPQFQGWAKEAARDRAAGGNVGGRAPGLIDDALRFALKEAAEWCGRCSALPEATRTVIADSLARLAEGHASHLIEISARCLVIDAVLREGAVQ